MSVQPVLRQAGAEALSDEQVVERVLASAFQFMAVRCDRVVARVFEHIAGLPIL